MRYLILTLLLLNKLTCLAGAGEWKSITTGTGIIYTVNNAKTPVKDFYGDDVTVIYLQNLNIKKIGRNSNQQNVAWLLAQGYRVISLDYAGDRHAVSPAINQDIIALNDSIAKGSFCGYRHCSSYQTYILFEGYRIARNVPYFKDDPRVYNTPENYINGDSLRMDIIYPANPAKAVPVILSFSYSNSFATYDPGSHIFTDEHKNQRLNQKNSLGQFKDSFLEGAPASGMAWAIADHPKYCPWGKGKPVNGKADTYKSFETNPDAARKVKSALRTLRQMGKQMGLSGQIGIFGFSRGSTAGSMAIGDKFIPDIENTGLNIGISDHVQAAALGPGVFDYTKIYNAHGDGDINLEIRCVWAWGQLETNYTLWQSMGSAYLAESSATAPVIFFYNTDDDLYYQDQIAHFKHKLDSLHVPNTMLVNYGKGHAIPQTASSLNELYNFFKKYLKPPAVDK